MIYHAVLYCAPCAAVNFRCRSIRRCAGVGADAVTAHFTTFPPPSGLRHTAAYSFPTAVPPGPELGLRGLGALDDTRCPIPLHRRAADMPQSDSWSPWSACSLVDSFALQWTVFKALQYVEFPLTVYWGLFLRQTRNHLPVLFFDA